MTLMTYSDNTTKTPLLAKSTGVFRNWTGKQFGVPTHLEQNALVNGILQTGDELILSK